MTDRMNKVSLVNIFGKRGMREINRLNKKLKRRRVRRINVEDSFVDSKLNSDVDRDML